MGSSLTTAPTVEMAEWVEDGNKRTAPAVDPEKFGDHDYGENPYSTDDCRHGCGCWAGESRSGGPIDPWGPCPNNPRGAVSSRLLPAAQEAPTVTPRLTDEQLQDLQRHLGRAGLSPRPWNSVEDDAGRLVQDANRQWVIDCVADADEPLIVAAVNSLGSLLAEVAESRAVLARIKGLHQFWLTDCAFDTEHLCVDADDLNEILGAPNDHV